MAFRDDRDAQLARATALERENERLKEELARREAEAEKAIGSAEESAALREELARARAKLVAARGPGLARRIGARIAALRLAEPSGDGGYWRAALEVWRLYVPLTIALLVTAPIAGGRAAWMALVFAVAAPALAALVLIVPWLLGRRRRAIAGAIAGGALGPPLTLALVDSLIQRVGDLGTDMVRAGAIALIAVAGMVVLRGLRFHAVVGYGLIFVPILALPHPGQLLLWVALAAAGSELVEPSKD